MHEMTSTKIKTDPSDLYTLPTCVLCSNIARYAGVWMWKSIIKNVVGEHNERLFKVAVVQVDLPPSKPARENLCIHKETLEHESSYRYW